MLMVRGLSQRLLCCSLLWPLLLALIVSWQVAPYSPLSSITVPSRQGWGRDGHRMDTTGRAWDKAGQRRDGTARLREFKRDCVRLGWKNGGGKRWLCGAPSEEGTGKG